MGSSVGLRIAFSCEQLRYILPVHEHVGEETVIDVSAVRDDFHRSAAEQLFQPLLGGQAFRFAQLRCVDAA
jgi:hypothetical protein